MSTTYRRTHIKGKQLLYRAVPFAVGLAAAIIMLLLFAPVSRLHTVWQFLSGAVTSRYYIGTVLNTATLLITAALGSGIAITAGEYNIGGEGQIYAGGFTAAVILAHVPLPPALALVAAGLAGSGVSALLALISAALRHFKNASVLLTSFVVSSAVIPIIDGLIAGPARGQTGNLLATAFIPENTRFPRLLPPAPLSAAAAVIPLLCVCAWWYLYRTTGGRRLRIRGTAPLFAEYCGYPRAAMLYGALAASGAFHGLCGFIAVCGTYFTCHTGFYSGIGWNALSCALIAQSHPIALIPAGLVLSWLFTSASRVAIANNFGFDMNALIQGLIIFALSIKSIRRNKR
ncbi:MAG: ABC transporter permease [Treponema sp.]|nr:ABC transporter permease [Treponema sp.]